MSGGDDPPYYYIYLNLKVRFRVSVLAALNAGDSKNECRGRKIRDKTKEEVPEAGMAPEW